MLGCAGRCREVFREVWGNVLGCGGGVEKYWGRCGKVCWGVRKVRGDEGRGVGK